jgi:hypothetical protein
MKTSNPFVLISADVPDVTGVQAEMRRTWFELKLTQLGFSFRKVSGSYKHEPEVSYIVLIESDGQYASLFRLADAFKQEAVIIVDANGYAALFAADGNHIQELGEFREVSAEEAANEGNYTHVDGRYYAAKEI